MYIILTEMDSGNIMLVLCGLFITMGCCIGCCVSGHKPLDIFKEIFISIKEHFYPFNFSEYPVAVEYESIP